MKPTDTSEKGLESIINANRCRPYRRSATKDDRRVIALWLEKHSGQKYKPAGFW